MGWELEARQIEKGLWTCNAYHSELGVIYNVGCGTTQLSAIKSANINLPDRLHEAI